MTLLLILVMAAHGCTDAVAPPLPLELEAEISVNEEAVHYTLFARNLGTEGVVLTRVCGPTWQMSMAVLRVYDVTDSTDPLWDHRLVPHEGGCWTPDSTPVMAGERSALETRSVPVTEILGDSIPPGTYRLAVLGQFEPELPVMEVMAGEFALTR